MPESLASEVSTAKFGDKRLTRRLEIVVDRLGAKPNMSIPAATNGRAEMEAAYRLFNNGKVTPDGIHDPHRTATLERIRQVPVVLLPQDTTELDTTRPQQQVKGAGPMECESRTGAFYHSPGGLYHGRPSAGYGLENVLGSGENRKDPDSDGKVI